MMQKAVEQSDDASSIWKHLVPLFEGSVGRENDRLALITSVDDFIE
jgi:hypothetical protein